MSKQESNVSKIQEYYLLQTNNVVARIVSRKLRWLYPDSIEDVRQQIFLNLWRWWSNHQDKELSEEEWKRLANTAAHNTINDFFSKISNKTILFSQMNENAEDLFPSSESASPAGSNSGNNSNSSGNNNGTAAQVLVETESLLRLIWKLMQKLTLRQKYAYLFHQPDFIIDFIGHECCSMKELADYFEITGEEFDRLFEMYPLADEQIALLLEGKLGKKFAVQNVWKARSEAKKRIAERLAGYIGYERMPDRGRS